MTPIERTQLWLAQVVVGMELCPFARFPFEHQRIVYTVYEGTDLAGLLAHLAKACTNLMQEAADTVETSLVIAPDILLDFHDYNQFLAAADALLEDLDLIGILQIASFHPNYQFAGTTTDDPENYTNRSPYPMFHLLREDSLEKAIASYDGVDDIPDRNIKKMNALGKEGLKKLWKQWLVIH